MKTAKHKPQKTRRAGFRGLISSLSRYFTRGIGTTLLVLTISVWTASGGFGAAIPPMFPLAFLQTAPLEQADRWFQEGVDHYQNHQLEQAIISWQQALSIFQHQSNRSGEAATLEVLSIAYLSLQQYHQAIAHLQALLPLTQTTNNPSLQAQTLGNLGIAYRSIGQYTRAIEVQQQALTLMQSLGDRQATTQIFSNLGNVYKDLGEYEQAIAAYEQSLAISRAINNRISEGIALGNLGAIYATEGEYETAITNYQDSLAIAQATGDRSGQANLLLNIGSAYHAQDNYQEAISRYQQSLELSRDSGDRSLESLVLINLGSASEDLGNYQQAIDDYQQSLAIAQDVDDPNARAIAFNNLGHVLFGMGRLAEAEEKLRDSIHVLEALRVGLSDNYNVSLFDTQVLTYNLLQQILVAQNKFEDALEVAEQGRTRAFADLLARRSLTTDPNDQNSPDQNPSNNQITTNSEITLAQIKQVARKQNTTLVEYSIIPDDAFKAQGRLRGQASRLLVWVIKPTGEIALRQVDLKAFQETTNLSLTDLISGFRDRLRGETRGGISPTDDAIHPGNFVRQVDEPPGWQAYTVVAVNADQTVTLHHPDFAVPNPVPLSQVYRVETPNPLYPRLKQLHQLLVAPIADLLPPDPEARVVFIPQDQLFLIPFTALQDEEGKYLIEQHTILTAPSIQVLRFTQSLHQQIRQTSQVLIIGNPSPMPDGLPALPFSETEAGAIAQILQVAPLVGQAATETVVKQRIGNATLIHLATHGIFNETNPLQGAIALAPDPLTANTAIGIEKNDGLLTAEEILNYRLQAELVILSACNTGRGRITGDGVVGLSRSLIAAGVPSVIVSLWSVPDQSTAKLMTAFYQNRQQGQSDAKALRQAMLTTKQANPTPLNWAGFTLIGGWN
jgi:CHAT domain-containing protein